MKSIHPYLSALALAACALLLALLPIPTNAAESPSPWSTLDTLRGHLTEAGAIRADFTQTYVPAGFSSGEQESGTMTLALPECMRWDYTEPYAKSFLLCGDQAHYWNEEDSAGRRYDVDRQQEPGLDLLMLSVETLRDRYRANAETLDDGRMRITLTPLADVGALAEASLTVAAGADRLTEVSYRDREGNRTDFSLATTQAVGALAAPAASLFKPPTDIRWRD